MFVRQLKAIGYPHADIFSIDDEKDFRQLVTWLATEKLKLIENSNDASMRDIIANIDDQNWNTALASLLSQNNMCPFESTDRSSVAGFLLQLAVRADYARNTEKYRQITAGTVASGSGNIFDSMPLVQVKAGIEALARALNIPHHYDHMVMLRAVAYLLKERLSERRLSDLEASAANVGEGEKIQLELEDIAVGMDLNKEQLSIAVKALRLLHIRNLRELQTMVDEVIVVAQTITADPKTDQRLGQVGR